MLILFIFFLILSIFEIAIIDIQTVSLMYIIFFLGIGLIVLLNRKDLVTKIRLINIFQVLFIAGNIYILLCYIYMTSNNYEYLLAIDIQVDFIPAMNQIIQLSNYSEVINYIWDDYTIFSRYYTGFYSYSAIFALLARNIDANLYVSLQYSVLLLSSLSGVIIYKLLISNNITHSNSFKYSIVICMFSVVFFYSTQFLRDIHIMLLYLIAIYLTFKKNSFLSNLLKLIIVIILTCVFRIESGLFLFILIPIFLLINFQFYRNKWIIAIISFVVLTSGITLLIPNYHIVKNVFTNNKEIYVDPIARGSGIIGTLQKIPIIGDFASIVYNAALPIPLWSKWSMPNNDKRPEIYNIMTFPLSVASFFNWFVIIYIIYWLFSLKIRKSIKGFISKPLKFHLWIGLIFLLLQSAVTDKRRLLGYYVVFYILFFIIFSNLDVKKRNQISTIAFISFVFLQIIGTFYLK